MIARKGTNGVSTDGISADFMFFDRGTFWVLPLTYFYLPKSAWAYLFPQSVKAHYFCSGPISADPICPQASYSYYCYYYDHHYYHYYYYYYCYYYYHLSASKERATAALRRARRAQDSRFIIHVFMCTIYYTYIHYSLYICVYIYIYIHVYIYIYICISYMYTFNICNILYI